MQCRLFNVDLNHEIYAIVSSRLLSKNLKIKIYKTIILPVVLFGCETSSLTVMQANGFRKQDREASI